MLIAVSILISHDHGGSAIYSSYEAYYVKFLEQNIAKMVASLRATIEKVYQGRTKTFVTKVLLANFSWSEVEGNGAKQPNAAY
uniref:AlNc14C278G10078 protein n=1 Tax=Albugo laibachii Nc14 TaxID=890382 RepID=F0WUT0_9STRA|nr:AlNc14C278G10078 [Albugo laibachii Nc14]|eukprot:CCA25166.1 AlNc14C278G10078 [Albugo laibachii Nc14]